MVKGKVYLPMGGQKETIYNVLIFKNNVNERIETTAYIPEGVTHIDMFLVSGGRNGRSYGGGGGFALSWFDVDVTEIPGFDPNERNIDILVGRGGMSRDHGGEPSRVGNDSTIPVNTDNRLAVDFTSKFPWNDAPYTVAGATSYSSDGIWGGNGVTDGTDANGQGYQGGSDGIEGPGTNGSQGFSTRAFNQKYDEVAEEWVTNDPNSTNELFSGAGSARTTNAELDPTPGGEVGGGAGGRVGDAGLGIDPFEGDSGVPGTGGGGGAPSGGTTGRHGGSGCVMIRYKI